VNEKQNILVMTIDEAQEKPCRLKLFHILTLPEVKRNSDVFPIDWQMEESSADSENNFSARRQKIASGPTNGQERHTISFVSPRLKPNNRTTEQMGNQCLIT
jgi:hypothetical protein